MTSQRNDLEKLGAIPRDDDGPVFDEPWQAQAFALAVRLSEECYFTWDEWATTLSEEITRAQAAGDADLGDTYYQHWAAALERLCAEKGLVPSDALDVRTEDWRQAYLNTPHGKPIELSAATLRGPFASA